MTHFHALTPRQAIKVVEAAGVEDAAKLIRDHAAAGLVKSYAHMQVTIAADGRRSEVRDAAVAVALWERIVHDGVDGDVWNGGTVRLAGSDLIGGTPAVHITGVAFNPAHVQRLADQQGHLQSTSRRSPRPAAPAPVSEPVYETEVVPAPTKRASPDPTA